MSTRERTDVPIYQLEVTLQGITPPIWRRLQVNGDTSLFKLHRILQVVMGWEDSHLHQFVVAEARYGIPDSESGGMRLFSKPSETHSIQNMSICWSG